MFPSDPRPFLSLLVCFSSVATAFESNATGPRTFLFGTHNNRDEPIDFTDYFGEDAQQNASPNRTLWNGTDSLSEDALLFLTGPISKILIPSFYTLVFCISVPINLCAIIAFFRGIRPKKPAAIYMLNLAFTDLLFSLMLPFKIHYHFQGNNWIFGWLLCRVVTASFYWNMHCSVLVIACISVDRFLAVVYPIDSLRWRKPRNTVGACLAMWLLSCAASVPLVLNDQTFYLAQLNITTCHDVHNVDRIAWLRNYFISVVFVLFFAPFLVTVGSYTKVIWTLSGVTQGLQGRSRKRQRAIVMILTVLVIFVLCFMPTNCLLLVHYLLLDTSRASDVSYMLYLMFLCVGSLNCLLDPLLYYFGSSQCQRQLSSMLCERSRKTHSLTKSSSSSYRSSTRPILKSSRTESSKISTTDSLQANLDSQYNKLLI